MEKRNFCNKTIYRLQLDDGSIITNPKEILKAEKDYFASLYSTALEPDLEYVANLNAPQISEDMKNWLESDITDNEIDKAVSSLANGKAPSTDGLPIEWYKVFWPKIRHLMYDLYREVIDMGVFHITARQGVITLLEKPDRHEPTLKSWRPLTLLNSDYKILSKVLSNILHSALSTVVNRSQTGFLKGRYMSENVIKLLNLIEHCNRNEESAVVISIDFEKAFDKLEFVAALESLKVFGIGPRFILYVKTLYNKSCSTVINNGYWSEWFTPTRGTHQGDLILTLIFTATAEVLGIKLHTNVEIAGV